MSHQLKSLNYLTNAQIITFISTIAPFKVPIKGAEMKSDYKQCSVCGKLIKIKSKHDGSSKYCESCAKKIELEKTRERMVKYREKL